MSVSYKNIILCSLHPCCFNTAVPFVTRDTHIHTHTDAETYVTCSEKAELEPQRPGPISKDIHTLCIDVAKETSQRHHWSSEEIEGFCAFYYQVSLNLRVCIFY